MSSLVDDDIDLSEGMVQDSRDAASTTLSQKNAPIRRVQRPVDHEHDTALLATTKSDVAVVVDDRAEGGSSRIGGRQSIRGIRSLQSLRNSKNNSIRGRRESRASMASAFAEQVPVPEK